MNQPATSRHGWPAATGCLLALFFLTTWPPILLKNSSYGLDERAFHYPTIRMMADRWPAVDLRDEFLPATGPLYHFALAALPRAVVDHLTSLKLVSNLFSLALLLLAFREVAGCGVGPWVALALVLPMACSQGFQVQAIWLMTDNFAWLFVFAALFDPLVVEAPSAGRVAAYALGATLATAARQINLWLSVPVALTGLVRTPLRRLIPRALGGEEGDDLGPPSWSFAVPAALGVLGPVAVLAFLYHTWGGLVPPALQSHHSGYTPMPFSFAMTLIGLNGLGFATMYWPHFRLLRRAGPVAWAFPGLVAAYVLAFPMVLSETNSMGAMRWAVNLTPGFRGRSSFVLALSVAGAALMVLFWLRARELGRVRPLAISYAGLAAWIIVMGRNPMMYQRYYEVLICATLAVLVARYGRPSAGPWPRLWWSGPLLLGAGHLCFSSLRLLSLI